MWFGCRGSVWDNWDVSISSWGAICLISSHHDWKRECNAYITVLFFFPPDAISLSLSLTPCYVTLLLSHPLTFNPTSPTTRLSLPLTVVIKPIAVAVMQHPEGSWRRHLSLVHAGTLNLEYCKLGAPQSFYPSPSPPSTQDPFTGDMCPINFAQSSANRNKV